MNWYPIFVICGLMILIGLVLYLPFFIWFRWQGSRPQTNSITTLGVTGAGLCFFSVTLIILFAGLAVGQLAPQSWFGSQVRTLFGGLGYMTAVCLLASVVERVFIKRGFVFLYRTASLPQQENIS
jgi:hypothetical protein